jgi:hypothetical protein
MRTPSSRDKCKAPEVQSETHASRGKADRPAKSDDIADPLLRHAVENKVVGLDGLQAARLALVKVFGRIERIAQKIDEAFSGAPFLLNLPPDCPANRRRFNTYFNEHRKTTQLLGYALELWGFACGLKREDDWTPVLVADVNREAFREVWRQDPNRNAAVSVRSAPGDRVRAPTGKTDRAPVVTQIDIGRSNNFPANKNRAARKTRRGGLASPK